MAPLNPITSALITGTTTSAAVLAADITGGIPSMTYKLLLVVLIISGYTILHATHSAADTG